MVELWGEGSDTNARRNKLPAGGDLAGRHAESSMAPAQSDCENNKDSFSDSKGYVGSRSHSSSNDASQHGYGVDVVEEIPPPKGFPKPNARGLGDVRLPTTSA